VPAERRLTGRAEQDPDRVVFARPSPDAQVSRRGPAGRRRTNAPPSPRGRERARDIGRAVNPENLHRRIAGITEGVLNSGRDIGVSGGSRGVTLRDFRLLHAIQRRYVLVAIVQVHRGPGACRIDADPRRDPVLLLCALACDQRGRLHAAAADRRGTAAALRIVIGLLPASS
jgi:hypothetical protein